MTDAQSNLPLWPFLAADALLVGAGGLLLCLGHRPLLWWEASLMVVCVAGAAGSFISVSYTHLDVYKRQPEGLEETNQASS